MKTLEEIKIEFEELWDSLESIGDVNPNGGAYVDDLKMWNFIESTISQTRKDERKAIKKRFDRMIIGIESPTMVAVKAYRAIDNKQK